MRSEPPPSEKEPDPLQVLGANVVVHGGRVLWDTGEAVPDLLWHYTDAPGTLGILRGRAFWATHVLFMNDASELRLAYPLLEDALEAARKRGSDNEILELLTVALGAMVSQRPVDPEVYAVCFCEDGDLLSQWRAYGVSGGGYPLGLDATNMKSDADATYGLSLSPVVYDADQQQQLAQQLVDRTIAAFAQHLKTHPGDFENAVRVTGAKLLVSGSDVCIPDQRQCIPRGARVAADLCARSEGPGGGCYAGIPQRRPRAGAVHLDTDGRARCRPTTAPARSWSEPFSLPEVARRPNGAPRARHACNALSAR